ncbi:MAG: hypothetical protein A2Z44_10435 [Betaproteobacteria bacterium RBG_19FT_COMBO_58_11]|nr:MAG: hypothetical protein A2Z44_10435 [Betaproteobacteria bacterium RBG_19FT_COMBO_58_11]
MPAEQVLADLKRRPLCWRLSEGAFQAVQDDAALRGATRARGAFQGLGHCRTDAQGDNFCFHLEILHITGV